MARNRIQRLYLAKGDKEQDCIYVDTVCLPQHQYDGIRFLYRQFKKGKPGVILNDPAGYGKRVQTLQFLSAIRSVMTLPTLVLCNEGIQDVWTQLFHQWTNMGSDVVVQKANDYTKSLVVVGTLSQVNALCRREWGVLVVDDNNVSKETLRAGINAKYRIWLTSLDMKKNLPTFFSIYKWLYPKDRLLEDLQANKKPTALYAYRVKLDAFMENVVIRRRDVAVLLGKPCDTPDEQRVSRKNKDATGRKIKRSKPMPDDDLQDTGSAHGIPKKLAKNREIQDKKESTEDFVVNIEERESEIHEDIDNKLTNVTSNLSNDESNCSIMKSGDNVEKHNELMNIAANSSGNEVPESDSPPKSNTQDSFTLLNDFIPSENIVIKYDSETQDNEIENDILAKKLKITNDIKVSEDLFSTNIIPSDINSDKVNDHGGSNKINEDLEYSDDVFTQAY